MRVKTGNRKFTRSLSPLHCGLTFSVAKRCTQVPSKASKLINNRSCAFGRARALRSTTSSSSAPSPAASASGASEDASLYTKQFVYSKASQYRKLKSEWKSNVHLGRSNIQVFTEIQINVTVVVVVVVVVVCLLLMSL